MVIAVEQGKGKKGGMWSNVVCLDVSDKPMHNTFDYQFSEYDQEKVGDPLKLKGQQIDLAITEIAPGTFGPRLRMRGEILTAPKLTK